MSPVEDVATAIAASVRANGWGSASVNECINIYAPKTGKTFCRIFCESTEQAKQLAEMMRKPAAPVFEAMGFDPLPPFPGVRKS